MQKSPINMTDQELEIYLWHHDDQDELYDEALDEFRTRQSCAHDARIAEALGRAHQ